MSFTESIVEDAALRDALLPKLLSGGLRVPVSCTQRGIFYRRGIIEAWGRGTIKMAELVTRAGLPPPEILEAGGSVVVRFRPSSYVPPSRVAQNVTERQRAILACLSNASHGCALRDIRQALGNAIPEWEIKNDLSALKHLGLVATKGYARGARWLLT